MDDETTVVHTGKEQLDKWKADGGQQVDHVGGVSQVNKRRRLEWACGTGL